MTRAILTPLQLAYGAALRLRNARYENTEPARLRRPVVSIGNLSMGGSGKTPLVICLAQLLGRRGWRADVLSRGYGRSGSGAERVLAEGDGSGDAARFGDEPLLIAREARMPVFVAASRYEAGLLAEREIFPRQVHLLDDGFQHRQLGRTVDIVLVRRSDLEDRLLPAGRLREPLAALKRAHIIVLREEDADLQPKLEPYTQGATPFWQVKRRLSVSGEEKPGEEKRMVAFCAIARPRDFFRELEAEGVEIAAAKSFRDHHRYTGHDMTELAALGTRHGCAAFVTTGKDAVKLDSRLREYLLKTAPLRVASLSLEILEEAAAMEQLMAMLEPLEPLKGD